MIRLQAQQFSWIKQHYPSLYEKMKVYIKQGRFIPVGGTWIEMDGNIPRYVFLNCLLKLLNIIITIIDQY